MYSHREIQKVTKWKEFKTRQSHNHSGTVKRHLRRDLDKQIHFSFSTVGKLSLSLSLSLCLSLSLSLFFLPSDSSSSPSSCLFHNISLTFIFPRALTCSLYHINSNTSSLILSLSLSLSLSLYFCICFPPIYLSSSHSPFTSVFVFLQPSLFLSLSLYCYIYFPPSVSLPLSLPLLLYLFPYPSMATIASANLASCTIAWRWATVSLVLPIIRSATCTILTAL